MLVDIQALKAQQIEKADQVINYDDFDKKQIKLIGGTDVGFEKNGKITRAAIVILNYPDLQLVDYQLVRIPTCLPYIPGYLSFREYPALSAAWDTLKKKPDLLMVDGHGIAHPRRFGLASHIGVLLNIPTIGVAKNKLCGSHNALSDKVGVSEQLIDKKQLIGFAFRSKIHCKPLYISTGHRIAITSALDIVKHCVCGYRLPEPTRWADAVASEKPLYKKWLLAQKIDDQSIQK